jgi:dihydroneopterin aldolase / 2-amino-4-hydroxy-6-hydroxymethyldihydropteridine diphosphokinase
MKAWLCLGSNQDNPFHQLERTLKYLAEKCYIKILQQGKPISSKPYGYADQPDFANQLIQIETPLKAKELLAFLKNAEIELGRKPTFKYGPRLIDLDIIFFEDEVIKDTRLTVPHPGITKREYLLNMLNEMIPDYIHPELKLSIKHLYDNFPKDGGTS